MRVDETQSRSTLRRSRLTGHERWENSHANFPRLSIIIDPKLILAVSHGLTDRLTKLVQGFKSFV
jgi:hypothetical protein